jgi:hypothetical protein
MWLGAIPEKGIGPQIFFKVLNCLGAYRPFQEKILKAGIGPKLS